MSRSSKHTWTRRRGVAWRGVAWRGVAWRGVAWRGVAWRGVVWRSLAGPSVCARRRGVASRGVASRRVLFCACVRWQHARLSVDKGLEVVDDLEVLALQAVEVLLDLELDDTERVVLFPVAATHETGAGDAQHAGVWAGGRACGRGPRGAQVAAEQVRNVRRDVVAGLARHDLLDQLRRSDLLHPDLAAREPRAELGGAVERQPPSHANHCRHVREHQQASEHEAEASVAKGVDAERAASSVASRKTTRGKSRTQVALLPVSKEEEEEECAGFGGPASRYCGSVRGCDYRCVTVFACYSSSSSFVSRGK